LVKGQHTGARLAIYLKEVLGHLELTEGHLLGITIDNASSDDCMTHELKSTLQAFGIDKSAMRNHIPCIKHIIQFASGAFMSSLSVKARTKSHVAHEHNQQFGENESTDIGKSQRLRREGNARILKVSAMRPGLAKIIENVRISRHFGKKLTFL